MNLKIDVGKVSFFWAITCLLHVGSLKPDFRQSLHASSFWLQSSETRVIQKRKYNKLGRSETTICCIIKFIPASYETQLFSWSPLSSLMKPQNHPCGPEERANNLQSPFYLLPLSVKCLPRGTLTSPVIWPLLTERNPLI